MSAAAAAGSAGSENPASKGMRKGTRANPSTGAESGKIAAPARRRATYHHHATAAIVNSEPEHPQSLGEQPCCEGHESQSRP